MLAEKYAQLPDGMEPEDIQSAFDELFAEAEGNNPLDVVDAIGELADRQWHTYSVMPVEYKRNVEQWIRAHFQPASLEFIRQAGFVAGCLGLPDIIEMFRAEAKKPALSDDARNAMIELVEELTTAVHDPYCEMPKKWKS